MKPGNAKRRPFAASSAVAATALILLAIALTHLPATPAHRSGSPEPPAPSTGEAALSESADGSAMPQGAAYEDREKWERGTVLVELAEGFDAEAANARLRDLRYLADRTLDEKDVEFGAVRLTLADGVDVQSAASALELEPFVSCAQPNYLYHLFDDPAVNGSNGIAATSSPFPLDTQSSVPDDPAADPATGAQRDALNMVGAYDAWNDAKAEGSVAIAVLDSGCDATHPDLSANIIAEGAYNGISNSADVTDNDGHGTHVAGIAAAVANNGLGCAGLSYNARIIPVKVIDDAGRASSTSARNGLKHVAQLAREHPEYNIRVVNMSFGGATAKLDDADEMVIRAMDELSSLGIVCVCAAGNNDAAHAETVPFNAWPGDFTASAVSVMNADTQTTRANGSNYNVANQARKLICAPGTSIYSTVPGGAHDGGPTDFGRKTGTSMASPCVAGIAALLAAANPQLSCSQIASALYCSAQDMGQAGFDEQTGFGMVNAAAALAGARSGFFLTGPPTLLKDSSATLAPSSGGADGFTWTSSDPSVASVGQDGSVKGESEGYAIITATLRSSPGVELRQAIQVFAPTLAGETSLKVGTHGKWNVRTDMPGAWTWSSSDPAIAVARDSGTIRAISPGTVIVTASLSSNPAVSVQAELTVTPSTIDLSEAELAGIESSYPYTGNPVMPTPSVTLDGKALVAGTDYRLSYRNNQEVGVATLTVTGIKAYSGQIITTFLIEAAVEGRPMHRLYNPNSGEHFYTEGQAERDMLQSVGWRYEGTAWTAPSASMTPVYRLYNPNAGDHHYTTSAAERDMLKAAGWRYEGRGWYSDDERGQTLYRLYNPNARAGAHHYTTSEGERDMLRIAGWRYEGTCWYGMA